MTGIISGAHFAATVHTGTLDIKKKIGPYKQYRHCGSANVHCCFQGLHTAMLSPWGCLMLPLHVQHVTCRERFAAGKRHYIRQDCLSRCIFSRFLPGGSNYMNRHALLLLSTLIIYRTYGFTTADLCLLKDSSCLGQVANY